jgi:pyruvate dehydrogenase E1 component alpha subunit
MNPKVRTQGPSSQSAEIVSALRPDGTLAPEHDPGLSDQEVDYLYRQMVTTRHMDERLVQLQRQGRIGFHVGSQGEEASILGSAFVMARQDFLFPCYREFGAALMRGLPLQKFIDNMFGNANDTVQGRQMPNHTTCREVGWCSISSPVGTQITQAVGFAWAAKIRRENAAALVYFGDGATSSSDFHSGMNFAGVFKVPCVLLCRNNGWAISVPVERQTATKTFAEKAAAYGMPGVRVDGNDLFAMVSVTRRARERCERGEGSTLIEAITYRMGGHSTSDDPKAYRGSDELETWAARDRRRD